MMAAFNWVLINGLTVHLRLVIRQKLQPMQGLLRVTGDSLL
jgi:hypothetical protein